MAEPTEGQREAWCICAELAETGIDLTEEEIETICDIHVMKTVSVEQTCLRPQEDGGCYWRPHRSIENPAFGEAFIEYLGEGTRD